MPTTAKTPALFDLCGGHPALDFVNSLDNRFRADGPTETLVDYGALLKFMEQTHQMSPQQARQHARSVNQAAATRALQSAYELREATAAAFYATMEGKAPAAAGLRTLERHFLAAGRHRELLWAATTKSANARPDFTWTWGSFEKEPDLPVWMLAQSVSDLMTSDAMAHVRTCGVDTCRWLFLDTSKNHTRRWCNMRVCGNRMKARRFQERREG
jgi:predicted RNA-binding Zn ribbon-like protein